MMGSAVAVDSGAGCIVILYGVLAGLPRPWSLPRDRILREHRREQAG